MANKQSKPALGKGIASLLKANTSDDFLKDLQKANVLPSHNKIEESKIAVTQPRSEGGSPLLVDVNNIEVNKLQPRKIFKEKDLADLTASIKENGVLQPLVAIDLGNGKFELIAGERRLRASKRAGLERVPVILKRTTDREKLVLALIENIQRSDLNCVEEALGYFQLMDEFKLTQEELAKKVGKDRSVVANFLRILKLPRETIELLQSEKLSLGHAKILAGLKDDEKVKRLARQAVQEELSVRELEKLSKKRVGQNKAQDRDLDMESKLVALRDNLEKKTGFHFQLSNKNNGSGIVSIKFNNEAEFNDIYDFLLRNA